MIQRHAPALMRELQAEYLQDLAAVQARFVDRPPVPPSAALTASGRMALRGKDAVTRAELEAYVRKTCVM